MADNVDEIIELDADVIDADVHLLEENNDNIKNESDDNFSAQMKLMSFLSAAMQYNKNNAGGTEEENEEIVSKIDEEKLLLEKIELISDTSNLIYDETCSITINSEQIKDDIDDLKNKFNTFQIEIETIKYKIEELLQYCTHKN